MKCYYLVLLSAVSLWNTVESQREEKGITISKYPFMVQVNSKDKRVCEGSIISAQWILTAASCIKRINERDLSIRYGTLIGGRGGFTVPVVKKINHPEYNRTTMENDVALLKIRKVLNFAHNKKPIKLAKRGLPLEEGANVTVVGWGIDQADKGPSNNLDAVDIATVSNTECIKSNETEELPEGLLCAGELDENGNICFKGEGGGPVIVEEIQVGIVSKKYCNSFMFVSVGNPKIRNFISENAQA
ncbi:trypsin-4-like [Agrilus planipennis]|uniref:Trypsin-4-like n=1 Tax=Agrilus planipennis TaxID=224129 RepID=A0A1W4X2G7_AGRPL|nr:trypsin-4-like [Agrilus planipennis]